MPGVPRDLRGRLEDRLFHGVLQGDRGGRAPIAAPEQAEQDGPGVRVDVQQFDVAVVLGQERPDTLESPLDTRRHVFGMEAVDDQEAGHELVVDQSGHHVRGAVADQVHDAG